MIATCLVIVGFRYLLNFHLVRGNRVIDATVIITLSCYPGFDSPISDVASSKLSDLFGAPELGSGTPNWVLPELGSE